MENQLELRKLVGSRSPEASRDVREAPPPSLHPLLQLQQQVGNQAVRDLLRSRAIQARLAVSNPDEPEEREADKVADRIMRGHAVASVPASCDDGGDRSEVCQKARSEAPVLRQATTPVVPSHIPPIVSDVLRLPGHPLDSATRAFFEPQFRRDLSEVRIHTGSDAAESARSINALAYAAGNHLVFGDGQFSPDTESGKRLLAHELAHVAGRRGISGNSEERNRIARQAMEKVEESVPAASGAGPLRTETEKIGVAFDAISAFYLKAVAKNDSLEGALNIFITLAYGQGVMYGAREMERELGGRGNLPAIQAALEQFRTIRGDELIKRLVAEPNGLEIWKKVQDNNRDLEREVAEQYIERVEAKLLPSYALAEAKKTSKLPKKLQQIADMQIRPLIIEDLHMMVLGATQAVSDWGGLRIPKKHEKTSAGLEAGAAGTHFAMEAAEILCEETSLIVEIGIPELAILKLGLELAGIWSAQLEQEVWELKLQIQRDLERKTKKALIEFYDALYDHTYRQVDVLSLLCASRALRAQLDPEGPDKVKLQRFVREQVFGKDFPGDLRGAHNRASDRLAESSAKYQAKLGGE